jgi:hypothetical protein
MQVVMGYRLSKPDYASDDVYTIMCECWSHHRPTFSSLSHRFEIMGPDVSDAPSPVTVEANLLLRNSKRFGHRVIESQSSSREISIPEPDISSSKATDTNDVCERYVMFLLCSNTQLWRSSYECSPSCEWTRDEEIAIILVVNELSHIVTND